MESNLLFGKVVVTNNWTKIVRIVCWKSSQTISRAYSRMENYRSDRIRDDSYSSDREGRGRTVSEISKDTLYYRVQGYRNVESKSM